jgi:hypothetical protein
MRRVLKDVNGFHIIFQDKLCNYTSYILYIYQEFSKFGCMHGKVDRKNKG